MQNNVRQLTLLGLLVALASIMHVLESAFPLPLPIPGIKLGLANIVSIACIVLFGWKSAIYVSLSRVLIGSLFSGSFLGIPFIMSVSGAIVSILAIACLYHWRKIGFSLIGLSVVGAAVHNVTQNIIAAILISNANLLLYVPYLLLFAIPMGLITGVTAMYFLKNSNVTAN